MAASLRPPSISVGSGGQGCSWSWTRWKQLQSVLDRGDRASLSLGSGQGVQGAQSLSRGTWVAYARPHVVAGIRMVGRRLGKAAVEIAPTCISYGASICRPHQHVTARGSLTCSSKSTPSGDWHQEIKHLSVWHYKRDVECEQLVRPDCLCQVC